MSLFNKATAVPSRDRALPGRSNTVPISGRHFVSGRRIVPPFPDGTQLASFGLGCFWGAERKFWQASSVYATAVGYQGGFTPNPTYQEVCSGLTGHAEVVRVIFSLEDIEYVDLLKLFWESHNPTQGMRQGNDVGTQYRSAIYTYGEDQQRLAEESRVNYAAALARAGVRGTISTEIIPAPEFYYAEEYHQQYLAKNPNGYCGLSGCGVPFKLAESSVGQKV